MSRVIRLSVVMLLIGMLIALLAGCARQAPSGGPAAGGASTGPIKIGVVVPVTGPVATFGQSTRQGAELVFERVNREGGVLGRKLEIHVEDDAGKPEEAANVYEAG